jgi:hypothetical protein
MISQTRQDKEKDNTVQRQDQKITPVPFLKDQETTQHNTTNNKTHITRFG